MHIYIAECYNREIVHMIIWPWGGCSVHSDAPNYRRGRWVYSCARPADETTAAAAARRIPAWWAPAATPASGSWTLWRHQRQYYIMYMATQVYGLIRWTTDIVIEILRLGLTRYPFAELDDSNHSRVDDVSQSVEHDAPTLVTILYALVAD